jgi:hypothetical protein
VRRPQHFLLRVVRGGPLVPARLRWLDHAPDDPDDNKLDRGRLSIVCCADVAGAEVPPEQLTERLYRGPGHWKYAEPITESEYRYQLQRLHWAARHRPQDPGLRPRRAVDPAQAPLPDFSRENAL